MPPGGHALRPRAGEVQPPPRARSPGDGITGRRRHRAVLSSRRKPSRNCTRTVGEVRWRGADLLADAVILRARSGADRHCRSRSPLPVAVLEHRRASTVRCRRRRFRQSGGPPDGSWALLALGQPVCRPVSRAEPTAVGPDSPISTSSSHHHRARPASRTQRAISSSLELLPRLGRNSRVRRSTA